MKEDELLDSEIILNKKESRKKNKISRYLIIAFSAIHFISIFSSGYFKSCGSIGINLIQMAVISGIGIAIFELINLTITWERIVVFLSCGICIFQSINYYNTICCF